MSKESLFLKSALNLKIKKLKKIDYEKVSISIGLCS